MNGRRKSILAPKQRRGRKKGPEGPADSAAQPAAVPSAGTTYETNVAPDLIEEGRSPDRSAVPESECSLPGKNGAGTPD